MIKGLDDDEVEFLDLVDRTKMEEERKKHLEEEKEMRDFKAAVASLQEQKLNEKLKQELKNPPVTSKNTACGRYYLIKFKFRNEFLNNLIINDKNHSTLIISFSSRTTQLKLPAGVVLKRSDKQKQGKVFKTKI